MEEVLKVFCKRMDYGQFYHDVNVQVVVSDTVIYKCFLCYDYHLNRTAKVFEVVYGLLIQEVKYSVQKKVVNYVQKRTNERDVPNPWKCPMKTYEFLYQGFYFELQRVCHSTESKVF